MHSWVVRTFMFWPWDLGSNQDWGLEHTDLVKKNQNLIISIFSPRNCNYSCCINHNLTVCWAGICHRDWLATLGDRLSVWKCIVTLKWYKMEKNISFICTKPVSFLKQKNVSTHTDKSLFLVKLLLFSQKSKFPVCLKI